MGRAGGRTCRVGEVSRGDRRLFPLPLPAGGGGAPSDGPRRLAVAGFALTSPFVLIHAGAAWDDISRVQRLARAGWLGFENDPATPLAYVDRLWEAIGPLLLVSVVGVVAALLRRTRTDLVPLSFVGLYWLSLMPQQAHFDRYVLPLVPGARRPRRESAGRWSPSLSSPLSYRSPGPSRTHGS